MSGDIWVVTFGHMGHRGHRNADCNAQDSPTTKNTVAQGVSSRELLSLLSWPLAWGALKWWQSHPVDPLQRPNESGICNAAESKAEIAMGRLDSWADETYCWSRNWTSAVWFSPRCSLVVRVLLVHHPLIKLSYTPSLSVPSASWFPYTRLLGSPTEEFLNAHHSW